MIRLPIHPESGQQSGQAAGPRSGQQSGPRSGESEGQHAGQHAGEPTGGDSPGVEATRSAEAPRGSPDSLVISETFSSVQGEGSLTGVPSFFIRVSGCNLRCAWCDTPYASWKPEGTTRRVAELIDDAGRSGVRHAVVTGGEPMLFEAIEPLCAGLRERGIHVTIETAGTVFRRVACDLMSISPKLANSTPTQERAGAWAARHEERRINVPVLRALVDAYPDRQLKFVVMDPAGRGDSGEAADLAEIEALVSELDGVRPEQIMLMPEGVVSPRAEFKQWVARACVERGWRYCGRLHIEIFGNKRGT
ncbi:MAG: 7-carboxy-7-deazaguanine synthase QueE [Planctomycetota bacterium]|nr:7-carboxy-7-deazaguanine synthase QueE [Planctomycetota bacterium]